MLNKELSIGNAKIRFRNFEGRETKFNPPGRRVFSVFLDDDVAEKLKDDGWNIKYLTPRDPEDPKQAYLEVFVSFKNFPPRIMLISSKNKTILDAGSVSMLDWADIENVDLIARPYNWEVNGKVGIKAYLKKMYVTLKEDEFEAKYMDTPDSAASTQEDFD